VGCLITSKANYKIRESFLNLKIPAMHVPYKGLFYHTAFGQIYSGETIPLRGHKGLSTDEQCGDVVRSVGGSL
jgi:hypothetical protein